jgi:hypothetical protein
MMLDFPSVKRTHLIKRPIHMSISVDKIYLYVDYPIELRPIVLFMSSNLHSCDVVVM